MARTSRSAPIAVALTVRGVSCDCSDGDAAALATILAPPVLGFDLSSSWDVRVLRWSAAVCRGLRALRQFCAFVVKLAKMWYL